MVGGVLVTAAFGMVVGPLIAGVVMETAIGARGLFVFTACVMALLAFVYGAPPRYDGADISGRQKSRSPRRLSARWP